MSRSNILFIDVETIGLPITRGFNNYYNPSETGYYDSSRIIEIAYVICTYDGNVIKEYSSLITPNNFTIENTAIHGITTKDAIEKGVSIENVLDDLNSDLDLVDRIVAHNIKFDINNILSECYRANKEYIIQNINSKSQICTMVMGKQFMNIVKFPKLVDLYSFIFNKTVVNW